MQSLYFNNLMNKPKVREGAPTMLMSIGSDCGVFFIDETQKREKRSKEASWFCSGCYEQSAICVVDR